MFRRTSGEYLNESRNHGRCQNLLAEEELIVTVETWRSGCDEEHPPYKGKLAAHQTLLTGSNVKHIHLGDYFKHHGYWAEFQGQIFQVPLPPYAGIIICYFISEDRK